MHRKFVAGGLTRCVFSFAFVGMACEFRGCLHRDIKRKLPPCRTKPSLYHPVMGMSIVRAPTLSLSLDTSMCTILSHDFLLFAIVLMDFVREVKAYATKFRIAPNFTLQLCNILRFSTLIGAIVPI